MHTLAVNVAWDAACPSGGGATTMATAIAGVAQLLAAIAAPGASGAAAIPQAALGEESCLPAQPEWHALVAECLQQLQEETGLAAVPEAEQDRSLDALVDGLGSTSLQVRSILAAPIGLVGANMSITTSSVDDCVHECLGG